MGKEQELLDAARNGDANTIERILGARFRKTKPLASLRKSLGPNVQDSSGYTCLHHAALNGHKDVVDILLEYDANVNIVDSKGSSSLHLAAWTGNADIVLAILIKSAYHPTVNHQNNDEETPLHCAAQFGHSAVCAILLQHGADVTMRNFRQESPLDLACEYGRFESAEVLVRMRPQLITEHLILLHSPLHLAAKNGHSSVVKMLLNSGFDVNYTTQNGSALHEAAFYGKFEVVAILLSNGIDVNLTNHNGRTVLDLMAELNTSIAKQIEQTIREHIMASIDIAGDDEQPIPWQCISLPSNYCDTDQTSAQVRMDSVPFEISAPRRLSKGYSLGAASSGLSSPANSEFSYCEFVKPPPQFQSVPISASYNMTQSQAAPLPPPPPLHFRNPSVTQPYFTLPKQIDSGISSASTSETLPHTEHHYNRSQDCMLDDDDDQLEDGYAPLRSNAGEPIYACADSQPHSLPVVGQTISSFYSQPSQAGSCHSLRRVHPPAKPPRKLSQSGLSLEHSRSHHQLHIHTQTRNSDSSGGWAPVRRSNSNCSDQSIMCNDRKSSGRSSSLTSQQTLARFMVNCGDVYAQVDKSRKQCHSSSRKHTRVKSEQLMDQIQNNEPIYSTIAQQQLQNKANSMNRRSGKESSEKLDLDGRAESPRNHMTDNRKKRATISIPLKSFELNLDIDQTLPAAEHSNEQIARVIKQLKQDYKRERRKLCKQCWVTEDQFISTEQDSFQVILKDIEHTVSVEDKATSVENLCPKEIEITDKYSFGQLEVFDSKENEQATTFSSIRKQKSHRRMKSDDNTFNGLYHGAVLKRNSLTEGNGVVKRQLRKSKTTIDKSDLIGRRKFKTFSPRTEEQKKMHSLIKMLDEDSIDRNCTNGMRLFQFVSNSELKEVPAMENNRKYERSTLPRFLPTRTFDEKNEWNDIIRIFDTFEKKMYDGFFGDNREDLRISNTEQLTHNQCNTPMEINCKDEKKKRKIHHKYSRKSCEQISVEFWLASLCLIQYCDVLMNDGFDNLKFMGPNVMDEDDLLEVGIFKKEHRKTILDAARCLPKLQCYKFHNRKIDHWTVDQWLISLDLKEYCKVFAENGYTDMQLVRRLGPLQLQDLLEMNKLGHRKRIMASLDQRNCVTNSFSLMDEDLDNLDCLSKKIEQLLVEDELKNEDKKSTCEETEDETEMSISIDQTYSDILKEAETRDSLSEQDCVFNKSNKTKLGMEWKHDPIELYKLTCHYVAFYLGSTCIEHLQGLKSSEQSMRQLRKMLIRNEITKVPAVVISISYKGVRFIDVLNNKIICEHEICNVHFACQDMDDFKCFAYITKDQTSHQYYCHVFSAFNLDMANEILLTLGQAFEIAYRLEAGETIDSLRKNYAKAKLSKAHSSLPLRYSSICNSPSSSNTLSDAQLNTALQNTQSTHSLFQRQEDQRRLSIASSVSSSYSAKSKGDFANGSELKDKIKILSTKQTKGLVKEKPAVPQKPAKLINNAKQHSPMLKK